MIVFGLPSSLLDYHLSIIIGLTSNPAQVVKMKKIKTK